jgi:hydrogenase expression/formation protein HypD
MVSSEGACAAHYNYGRFRDVPVRVVDNSAPPNLDQETA